MFVSKDKKNNMTKKEFENQMFASAVTDVVIRRRYGRPVGRHTCKHDANADYLNNYIRDLKISDLKNIIKLLDSGTRDFYLDKYKDEFINWLVKNNK